MSKDIKVTYEPHPVSPERKAELRKMGYRILDAAFAPKGPAVVAAPMPAPVPVAPPPPAPAAPPVEKPKLTLPNAASKKD